ncbi:hypothetical protein [Cellulomonas sp. SLBN-39]|uniref:hypothetical protein n=1 Tax=Cellulomonas sp. SLBN-39 TaxID=2768446 RepID=UPI001153DC38|nr:hypothetical protein [Cellulomonas sp. SLBN-39]TQL01396.1 hypothetical protein FBY24_0445 [Cellulomonas sp. SLBN-39]
MAAAPRTTAFLAVAIGLLALTGCTSGDSVDVTNDAADDVTVRLGPEDTASTVTADGGVSLLDVTTCYAGPVVVTYADGRTVEIDGRTCPGDLVAVSDDGARLVPAADRPGATG